MRLSDLTRWLVACMLAGFGTGAIGQSVPSFLYNDGTFNTFTVPGAYITAAYDISGGYVVGFLSDSKGAHGFIYSNGTFKDIIVPGSIQGVAYGVNSAGHAVGVSSTTYQGDFTSFLYVNGTLTPYGVPGASRTWAYDINNAGNIVGNYDVCGPMECVEHGFLDVNGTFTNIDVPNLSGATRPHGINDAGRIVG